MTLAEIIAAHEAAHIPVAISDRAGLTDAGHAAVAARRFLKAIRALDPQERAEALAEFAPQLRNVIAELAAGARTGCDR